MNKAWKVPPTAALLDVGAVAVLCGCSPRHVRRLADAGKLPEPIRLGMLVRWRRAAIADWIEAGCPSMRRSHAGVGRNGGADG